MSVIIFWFFFTVLFGISLGLGFLVATSKRKDGTGIWGMAFLCAFIFAASFFGYFNFKKLSVCESTQKIETKRSDQE